MTTSHQITRRVKPLFSPSRQFRASLTGSTASADGSSHEAFGGASSKQWRASWLVRKFRGALMAASDEIRRRVALVRTMVAKYRSGTAADDSAASISSGDRRDHQALLGQMYDGIGRDVEKAWRHGGLSQRAKAEQIQRMVKAFAASHTQDDKRWAQAACALLREMAGPLRTPNIGDALSKVAVAHVDCGELVVRAMLRSAVRRLRTQGMLTQGELASKHSAHAVVVEVCVMLRDWAMRGYWQADEQERAASQPANLGADGLALAVDKVWAGRHGLADALVMQGPCGSAARVAALMASGGYVPDFAHPEEGLLRQVSSERAARMRMALVAPYMPAARLSELALRVTEELGASLENETKVR